MSSFTESFLREVEEYLDRSGLGPNSFGRRAMSDPRFVYDLRKGRAVSIATVDKVRKFMAENPPGVAA